MNPMAIPLAASVAVFALGCFSQRGDLYDVESGHTLNIEFKWNTHGGHPWVPDLLKKGRR